MLHTIEAIVAPAERDSGVCWPSQDTLALESGASTRAVRYALAELRALGWIAEGRRYDDRTGLRTSSYLRVTPPGLPLPPDPRVRS